MLEDTDLRPCFMVWEASPEGGSIVGDDNTLFTIELKRGNQTIISIIVSPHVTGNIIRGIGIR